jgi:hypothetical protein
MTINGNSWDQYGGRRAAISMRMLAQNNPITHATHQGLPAVGRLSGASSDFLVDSRLAASCAVQKTAEIPIIKAIQNQYECSVSQSLIQKTTHPPIARNLKNPGFMADYSIAACVRDQEDALPRIGCRVPNTHDSSIIESMVTLCLSFGQGFPHGHQTSRRNHLFLPPSL